MVRWHYEAYHIGSRIRGDVTEMNVDLRKSRMSCSAMIQADHNEINNTLPNEEKLQWQVSLQDNNMSLFNWSYSLSRL